MEQYTVAQGDDEYRQAFASVRCAKNWFLWLILLSLLIQLTCFVLVRYAKVTEAQEPAIVANAKTPASAPAESEEVTKAERWSTVLKWVLPVTRYVAFVAGGLLVLTLLLSVKLALVGRTGGVAGYISAFFWSLLLLVVLVPWQQVLPGSTVTCGVTYNLGHLLDQTAKIGTDDAGWTVKTLYYVRFIAYPVIVLILMLAVQRKYSRGRKRMSLAVESTPGLATTNSFDEDKI